MANNNKFNSKKGSNNSKNKGKSKGKSMYPGSGKFTSDMKTGSDATFNADSWHYKSENMLKDAASFPFNTPTGSFLNLETKGYNQFTGDGPTNQYNVPGIWKFSVALVPGIGKVADDPVNLAARVMYTYVRSKNSGAANYDAPDLMLYMMTMDQLYAYYAWMFRLYGVMRKYNQQNWYLGKALINAMGVDYEDLEKNLANYRFGVNLFGKKLQAWAVPRSMDIFERHQFMMQDIYKDGETERAQYYVFNPAFFFKFSSTTTTGGGLTGHPLFKTNGTLLKVADILNYANALLNPLMNETDWNIISGDIQKAYDNLWNLAELSDDYTVEPRYDVEMLSQIQNMTSYNVFSTVEAPGMQATSYEIRQDPANDNLIVTGYPIPAKDVNGVYGVHNHILTLREASAEPKFVMRATRLMCFHEFPETANPVGISLCGTEIVLGSTIYKYTLNFDGSVQSLDTKDVATEYIVPTDMGSDQVALDLLKTMDWVSKFDWHPQIYAQVLGSEGSANEVYFPGIIGDVDLYTVIDENELRSVHLTDVMSEFNIPTGR